MRISFRSTGLEDVSSISRGYDAQVAYIAAVLHIYRVSSRCNVQQSCSSSLTLLVTYLSMFVDSVLALYYGNRDRYLVSLL